ncbi:hypothetical protein N7523_009180 [Penicillium sp. IBT 18751x]|nr:hypothetical protein N7523_009180 [Penicillium sp. IBT 18751x]
MSLDGFGAADIGLLRPEQANSAALGLPAIAMSKNGIGRRVSNEMADTDLAKKMIYELLGLLLQSGLETANHP